MYKTKTYVYCLMNKTKKYKYCLVGKTMCEYVAKKNQMKIWLLFFHRNVFIARREVLTIL